MRKMIVALLIMLSLSLSLGQGQALAQTSCLKTINTGNATTLQNFYENPAAIYGWSGGVITNDLYANTCGRAVSIKVNVDDWLKLKSAGKLDGLRYIQKPNNIQVGKVVGTETQTIKPENFFN